MAKRTNITDALAKIAAEGEVSRDNVATFHVTTDNKTTENVTSGQSGPKRADSNTAGPAQIESSGYDAQGYRLRVRREKPHASLYAHPRVFAVIRDLATAQRRRPHDLYVEGLRMMLAKHGYDLDALERGES